MKREKTQPESLRGVVGYRLSLSYLLPGAKPLAIAGTETRLGSTTQRELKARALVVRRSCDKCSTYESGCLRVQPKGRWYIPSKAKYGQ